MTRSQETRFVGSFTVLVRAVLALGLALALCGAQEPFDFAEPRFAYGFESRAEASQPEAGRRGGALHQETVLADDGPSVPDALAGDVGEGGIAIRRDRGDVRLDCAVFRPDPLFVSMQAMRCIARPRGPPAQAIG